MHLDQTHRKILGTNVVMKHLINSVVDSVGFNF